MIVCRAPHDDVNGPLTERKLKIATLSGGIAASDPTPLYQYDIIVAVAGKSGDPQIILNSLIFELFQLFEIFSNIYQITDKVYQCFSLLLTCIGAI